MSGKWGQARKNYNPEKEGFGNSEQWQKAFKDKMYGKKQKKVTGLESLYSAESKEDLTKAYRILMNKYHPDKKGGDAEMAKKVNEAYTELINKF